MEKAGGEVLVRDPYGNTGPKQNGLRSITLQQMMANFVEIEYETGQTLAKLIFEKLLGRQMTFWLRVDQHIQWHVRSLVYIVGDGLLSDTAAASSSTTFGVINNINSVRVRPFNVLRKRAPNMGVSAR